MNTANDDPIVEIPDAFADGVVSAGAIALCGVDVAYDNTDDAITAAGGAAHG